jgi:single-strand DNA-binding protein
MPHLVEHLFKGSKALISGSLKQDHWETDTGEKRSRIVLNAYKVEFLDPAPEKARQAGGRGKAGARSGHRAA